MYNFVFQSLYYELILIVGALGRSLFLSPQKGSFVAFFKPFGKKSCDERADRAPLLQPRRKWFRLSVKIFRIPTELK